PKGVIEKPFAPARPLPRASEPTTLHVDAVIPALNEAEAIGEVLDAIPRPLVRRVIVCDNGSNDGTADLARAHGAVVAREGRRGAPRPPWASGRAPRATPTGAESCSSAPRPGRMPPPMRRGSSSPSSRAAPIS